jgi:dipeptidyl-peptidase-4
VLIKSGLDSLGRMPGFNVPYKGSNVVSFSNKGKLIHFDLNKKSVLTEFNLPNTAENIEFAPASNAFAFTQGDNVYVMLQGSNDPIAVTNDDKPGIVNGKSVHQNEFGINKGLFWSPSGQKLAFYRMDESMVSDYPFVDISQRVATAKPHKYPMAGMKSHEVTVGVWNPETKQIVWLQTGTPKEKYLTNIAWSPDEKSIYIAELNRDQNDMRLVRYSAITGKKEAELFQETNPRYVEPQNPVLFVPGKDNQFVWQSQKDGFNHLYLYDTDGNQLKQLTKGQWVVINVLGFDEKGENIFFTSTQPLPGSGKTVGSPLEMNAWKVNIKNGKETCLTNKGGQGIHSVQLSPSGKYIIDTYSAPAVPRVQSIVETTKGSEVNTLLTAKNPYSGYKMPEITTGTIKAADDSTDLYYSLVKPVDFDPNKKYPAIVYVYGGPHAQLVTGGFNNGIGGWDIYMAQNGYVIFTVDSRGSANRGFEFESVIHRNLGVNEMADQVKGVEFLTSLPYVDADRIGVDGWSYGGFMTTNLMLSYPEIFKVGVAGGPVIDWSNYEIMYGERYMDRPQDNPEGYKNANLKNKAGNLKGRLMIIHGDVDPVVVWQHSLGFLKAAVNAGTQPDYFVYPGHEHNVIGKDRPHLMEKITRYFDDYLKNGK